MRAKGFLIIVFIALVLAGTATAMVVMYLDQQAQKASAAPLLEPVVVSAADQSFGRTLGSGDLLVRMFPAESVPKGAVSDPDSLIGKTTKVFLAEGEPILVTKLSDVGGGLSLTIADSMRAVSIQVDKVSGVSGFVLPGDWVDVMVIVRPSGGQKAARSKTILQRIKILAAGEKTEQKGKDPITVQSVTLLVDQLGAEKLALAGNLGKIHLALRNPNDSLLVAGTGGVSIKELMSDPGSKPKPKPKRRARTTPRPKPTVAKREFIPDSMTIIRGTQASKLAPVMGTPEADTAKGTNK